MPMLAAAVPSPLVLAAILFAATGAVLIAAAVVALRRGQPLGFAVRTLTGLLLLSLGVLAAVVSLGMVGYRALTREEVAAHITVRPTSRQRFTATVRIPERPDTVFELSGDEIYVDAQILKWKPIANVLGLHTAYDLSRISGRYREIEQERTGARTVHSLEQDRPVDLFALRTRHAFLAPLLDAEYGSGTFVPVARPADLEVRVSTSGLLIREVRDGRR